MRPVASLALALGLLVLPGRVLFPGTARAADTPAEECSLAKLRAAGAEIRARILCEARRLVADDESSCIATAAARRERAFRHAEKRGGCTTIGDSAVIGDQVDFLVRTQIVDFVAPRQPATPACTQRLLGLVARAAMRSTQIHTSEAWRDEARLDAALAAARASFEAALRRAEASGCSFESELTYTLLASAVATLRKILCPDCGVLLCPCWTTGSLDESYPPEAFETLGGAGCVDEQDAVGVGSNDACYDPRVGSAPVAGIFVGRDSCAVFGGGGCWPQISFQDVTPEEKAICIASLRRSKVFREVCSTD